MPDTANVNVTKFTKNLNKVFKGSIQLFQLYKKEFVKLEFYQILMLLASITFLETTRAIVGFTLWKIVIGVIILSILGYYILKEKKENDEVSFKNEKELEESDKNSE